MIDPIRRKILKAGVAATVMVAAPRALAQQTKQGGAVMSFYEKGLVRIRYQETGSGFPLLLAPKAEVSMFPWKEPKERIPLAVRQIRSFLRAHRPASV